MSSYQPILHANEISNDTAVLYIVATQDAMCPSDRIMWAHNNTPNSQIFEINPSHIGIYGGIAFQESTEKQLEFLRSVL